MPSQEAAERFGYTPGSFRVLCTDFRKNQDREFFLPPAKGPRTKPKSDTLRDTVVKLRKQNLSIYDIHDALTRERQELSPAAIALILKEEGFAKLPRRRDDERPSATRPTPAEPSDARKLNIEPRSFHTRFGGLFLFVPYLAKIPLDELLKQSHFPGTQAVPAGHAIRSLLALKLYGNARHSHVMSHVFDAGLALFTGLNVIPKRSFLTEYSCRIHPKNHADFMAKWFDAMSTLGLERGVSFDLDFHTIPFHGEDALVQKHYVSKRSRRQKGVLAFLAHDGEQRVFCYANTDLRAEEHADEILRFVKYWKQRTGKLPEELIFDSQLTTYENLNLINQQGIRFITLRRRSPKMLEHLRQKPLGAWTRIKLENVSRKYRTPRILDEQVTLDDYEGPIRQISIEELGHEEPTLLITNQLKTPARDVVGRYARRMLIENKIADSIDFFHMDALSSAVAMKVDLDVQLTLMGSSLYRLLGAQIGRGYEHAGSRHIFRDFVEASADVTLTQNEILVRFQKRAHNPLLLNAGFGKVHEPVSWLGGKRLRLQFG